MDISCVIIEHLRTVTKNTIIKVIVDGESVETKTSGTVDLALFPIKPEEIGLSQENTFTFEDLKCYEIGSGTLNVNDEIIFNTNNYTIKNKADRDFDGGFQIYFAKREPI